MSMKKYICRQEGTMPFWWQVVPVMMAGEGEQPTLRISTVEKSGYEIIVPLFCE